LPVTANGFAGNNPLGCRLLPTSRIQPQDRTRSPRTRSNSGIGGLIRQTLSAFSPPAAGRSLRKARQVVPWLRCWFQHPASHIPTPVEIIRILTP
jgi:hypothetical protein